MCMRGYVEILSTAVFTHCKYNPWGGAVDPAAVRSRAAIMPGIFSGEYRPQPTSTSVPTMIRTMFHKNPVPSTPITISGPRRLTSQ